MIDQIIRELVQLMGLENRNRLLIAGADVESHITFLTLRALAEGSDVYLLSDLMASRDRKFLHIFQMRLFQAGAVPTTMNQFLLEGASDLLTCWRCFDMIQVGAEKRDAPDDIFGFGI